MKRFCIALALLFPLTAFGTQPIVIYTVKNLGTLGGTASSGNGINGDGVVVGAAESAVDSSAQHAFISGTNGALPLTNLGTLGGGQSVGNGVNASGRVAGASNFDTGFFQHAFISDANGGTLNDLMTLGGPHSVGTALNGAGQVAGYSIIMSGPTHAFLSAINGGGLQDLGTLAGGTTSFANAVNASGQVAGYSNTVIDGSTVNHAFITDANGAALRDLGALSGGDQSFGTAINDAGQVAGRGRLANFETHAFRSAPNGGVLFDLGTLGGTRSEAEGINNSGSVVGISKTANGTDHAFLYKTSFGMMDLNNLITQGTGWELKDAKAINDAGQITGSGTFNGETHAFLLTPIPPAATITSITRLSNGHILVEGFGTPLEILTVETTGELSLGFHALTTIMAGNDGKLTFEDAAPVPPRQFYRFVYP